MQIQITFAYTLTKQAIKTHVPSLKFRSPKPKLNLLQPSTLSPLSSNLILAILKSKIGFLEMNLEVDTKPSLLSSSDKLFTHTLTDAAKHHHQRRRRCSSSSSSSADAKPRDAPTRLNRAQSISHAAAETYLVTRLSFILLRYLGVGYRWITRLIALGCYALLLMPGFLQVAYYYFFSSQVRRSVVYGDQPRNRLDLFLPANSGKPKPVVIFVTGGAWIIGYKAWGSLLGQQLAERDIIVACIDYRNFPQGTIGDMVEDTSQGISFVCNHLAEYGGDPNRIYLMGQSAGAHISACALLEQAIKESEPEKGESITWSVSQLKAYFGLSGGYNLLNLVDHFNNRGLYRSIFLSIMEGEQGLQRFSPEVQIQDKSTRDAVSRLPPITLFHGTSDYSIPSDARCSSKGRSSSKANSLRGKNTYRFVSSRSFKRG
ncbi:hypothetical protein RGQ29_011326 [Quercus rubra]|uniref:protein-S-isoprenylcysteine alpha-carbonyl methylesterase n=1 Tax=Quercus rubra TaxID=3512 RepID=A0AAN7FXH7_QUERU|nr:hypothetical protein RGQ29_011326 [Quercus rubra]